METKPAVQFADAKQLQHSDPHRAYDLAWEALKENPADVRFRHIQAHALTLTGSPNEAIALLYALYQSHHRDPETLGLLGRAWKQIASDAVSDDERQRALRQSRDFYLEGLVEAEGRTDSGGYYPGINAATLSLVLGDLEQAKALAQRSAAVRSARGEGGLRLLEPLHARRSCADLRRHPGSTRTLLQSEKLPAKSRPSEQHPPQRPRNREAHVRRYVRAGRLLRRPGSRHIHRPPHRRAGPRGGDILFLEALQTADAQCEIVLPFEQAVFEQSSVAGGAPGWPARFARLCAEAKPRIANSHSATADGAAFEYGTRFLIGLARLRAQQLDADLRALVLWDGERGEGHGGTEWSIAHLQTLGVIVENIYPGREGIVPPIADNFQPYENVARPIRAMLFSDCKGYSKLREENDGDYTTQFLGGVSRLIARARENNAAPIVANTWGDGLFLAFTEVRAAADFAIALRDGALRASKALGLPDGVCLRIALHAGPVMEFEDPITQRPNLAGVNVSFTARIEPITPENQICASEAFAALAANEALGHLRFDYAGATEFAKHFGAHPIYRMVSAAPVVARGEPPRHKDTKP